MKLFYNLFDDWKDYFVFIPDVLLLKMSMSFDCYNLKTNKTVQLKSSSVYSDLSSFEPISEWDGLYFM